MKKMAENLVLILILGAFVVPCVMLATGHDIPLLGDSDVVFTMKDYRYSVDYHGSGEWVAEVGEAQINNPSPHKVILHLTNLDTGQEFTVRYRDQLKGKHYKVVRKTLDGETISEHELVIVR